MKKCFVLLALVCGPLALLTACAGDPAVAVGGQSVSSSSGTGAGGAGGSGGSGGTPSACAEDCAAIEVTEPCVERWTCDESSGSCVAVPMKAEGAYSGDQVVGDCQKIVCAGGLATKKIVDDEDVPEPTACMSYACSEGTLIATEREDPGPCEVETMSCVDGSCEGETGPTCNDKVQNGKETDVDCGGPTTGKGACSDDYRCAARQHCKSYADCIADHHCSPIDNVCVPVAGCDDPPQNPSEKPTKCGVQSDGTYCGKCGKGVSCASPSVCTRDCGSGEYEQDCSNMQCLNIFDPKYKCK